MKRTRLVALAFIAIACVVFAGWYTMRARRRAQEVNGVATVAPTDEARVRALLAQPHALFRTTRPGQGYGRVVVATPQATGERHLTDLECDRLSAVAKKGVCLTADRGVITTYQALVFDDQLSPRHTIALDGVPSRVRLSPDGRLAGITVFVSGHGYTDSSFSTKTILVDTERGAVLADLEEFAVTRDGAPFSDVNFNYWGVTFTSDSNTFYATLGSGKQLFLIRGDAAARRATVVREGIECPALSPDNTRIAFKKRTGEGVLWRLAVLDLRTGAEHLVAGETRNVDDQVEWLDDNRIVYAMDDSEPGRGVTNLWAVDVSRGPAALWADGADSPAIISGP